MCFRHESGPEMAQGVFPFQPVDDLAEAHQAAGIDGGNPLGDRPSRGGLEIAGHGGPFFAVAVRDVILPVNQGRRFGRSVASKACRH